MALEHILIGIFLLAALAFLFIYLDARKKNKQAVYTVYDLTMRNRLLHRLFDTDGFSALQLREIRRILTDDLKKVIFEAESEKAQHKPRTQAQAINYFYKRQDAEGLLDFAIARYTEGRPEFAQKYKESVKYLADNGIDFKQVGKEKS